MALTQEQVNDAVNRSIVDINKKLLNMEVQVDNSILDIYKKFLNEGVRVDNELSRLRMLFDEQREKIANLEKMMRQQNAASAATQVHGKREDYRVDTVTDASDRGSTKGHMYYNPTAGAWVPYKGI